MTKLLGNEPIKRIISQNTLLRSFIIEGPEGSGKHTLLDFFVKTKVCTAAKKPCELCPACKKYNQKVHSDIKFIDPETDMKDFRRLLEDVCVYPRDGSCKFYIISDAEKLSLKHQNTLLKLLEEPPEFAYFILLCPSKESLLKTVVSRCTVLTLMPLSDEHVTQWLKDKHKNADEAAVLRAVRGGRGYIGVAEKLFTSGKNSEAEKYDSFIAALARNNMSGLLSVLRYDNKKRAEFNRLIDLLLSGFKELAAIAGYGSSVEGLSDDERTLVGLGEKRLCEICEALTKTKKGTYYNINISLWSVYIVKECLAERI